MKGNTTTGRGVNVSRKKRGKDAGGKNELKDGLKGSKLKKEPNWKEGGRRIGEEGDRRETGKRKRAGGVNIRLRERE